jgi:acetolactate synthase-1/2/3 large subunit
MRVADYITDAIYKAGAETVFILSGGYGLPMADALLQHPKQKHICGLHEQAVSFAADGYARISQRIGAAYFTAGPGATNTVTGVAGAWLDSIPTIFVSGQQKLDYVKVKGPRQFGFQGFETLPIVESITKYAVILDDIKKIKYHVEKALYLAISGRPGPVWLEVPLDIQGASFNPDDYEGYTPDKENHEISDSAVKTIADIIKKSRRPCIWAGGGIRMSGAAELFDSFIKQTGIPVLTSRSGMDLIDDNNPLFIGRAGLYGTRTANFAVENCDVFLSIGSRLNVLHIGHDFEDIALQAKKIVVDIDINELEKPSIKIDYSVEADAFEFLNLLSDELKGYQLSNTKWVDKISEWKEKYNPILPEYNDEKNGVNTYTFFDHLSKKMPSKANVLLDACSAYYTLPQSFKVKSGQRHISTNGLGTMGFWAASVGTAVADSSKDTYCVCGDGSIQMNLQELQTISYHNLPVKIIYLNNGGYLCIKLTQENMFDSRFIGTHEPSGLSLPPIEKLAVAYDLPIITINDYSHLDSKLNELIEFKGPVICNLLMPADQLIIPRVMSKKLEDGSMISMAFDNMYPFLNEEEYKENSNWHLKDTN